MSGKATTAMFKRVKIFLTDVDGVLTDGSVVLDGKTEFKQFNVQDGMGLRLLQHLGIPVGWVSNRESAATTARAKELKVDYLWQKSLPKVAAIEAILKKAKFTWADACYVSDDLNDLAVLVKVGLPVAVAKETMCHPQWSRSGQSCLLQAGLPPWPAPHVPRHPQRRRGPVRSLSVQDDASGGPALAARGIGSDL